MLNKNYIIGGIVILAIIAGVMFLSRDNSSTPDASVLKKGVKNLTRESAARMIKTSFETKPEIGNIFSKTVLAHYDEINGDYGLWSNRFGGDLNDNKMSELESAGFIKMSGRKNVFGRATFKLTDQAKPYVKTTEGVEKQVYVILAEIISVEVTGITEAADKNGKTIRMANYTATYKPTPIGVINNKKTTADDVKAQAQFVLYDDGWRIAQ